MAVQETSPGIRIARGSNFKHRVDGIEAFFREKGVRTTDFVSNAHSSLGDSPDTVTWTGNSLGNTALDLFCLVEAGITGCLEENRNGTRLKTYLVNGRIVKEERSEETDVRNRQLGFDDL